MRLSTRARKSRIHINDEIKLNPMLALFLDLKYSMYMTTQGNHPVDLKFELAREDAKASSY
jgi:hypothetical protein